MLCLHIYEQELRNANYTMVDVDRLLHLIELPLPLGKDERERYQL